MGRRIRLREDDFVEDREVIRNVKDDRQAASKVKSTEDLKEILPQRFDRVDGAVGAEIRRQRLAEYDVNGKLTINSTKVKDEAQSIKAATLNARFYPEEELDRELDDIQAEYGISRKQARNLRAREAQIRAQAVLTAAQAGKVEIDRDTKGILNNYARGEYERAIYGNVDETTGKRTFARGRYFTELGFDDAERKRDRGAGTTVNTKAARSERRRDFIQNVQLANFGRTESAKDSFVNSVSGESKKSTGSRFAFARGTEEPRKPKRLTFNDDDIPF